MKILFTGYYGFNNFGDDLFPLASLEALKNETEIDIAILSPKIDGIDANFLVPDFVSKIYRGNSFLSKLSRMFFMLFYSFLYDKIVLAGGSVISSNTSNNMRMLQYILARIGVCKLYAIGVSVGPFSSKKDEAFSRKFINSLSYLSVRDNASVDECKRIKCTHIPDNNFDIAGVLYPYFKRNNLYSSNTQKLGVSLCFYERYAGGDKRIEDKRSSALIDGIINFCSKNRSIEVIVFVLNTNDDLGDYYISKNIFDLLTENGINVSLWQHANPLQSIEKIKECDFFITTRLHGGIAAYLSGINFCLVEYHRKCTDFNNAIFYPRDLRLDNINITSQRVDLVLNELLTVKLDVLKPSDYESFSLKPYSRILG
ncbi:hypothetical protein B4923_06900 [Brenneria roseae subsp. americana]|uniref:Polysaccharide pyruvyl transferase domain-containing protein n=1 Tax=Brenneria roseae subsp. americana TaxID=1508507 RepID=A0A2U1TWA8_9GAMM|nr:polysaccharide pyruvyl transferase family protein [Brenneria roseae]PWC13670.1 hypothetical protein B4923_06900 [Brenneria roseae subsp. americana]